MRATILMMSLISPSLRLFPHVCRIVSMRLRHPSPMFLFLLMHSWTSNLGAVVTVLMVSLRRCFIICDLAPVASSGLGRPGTPPWNGRKGPAQPDVRRRCWRLLCR